MIRWIREQMERRDEGFTLIELLVVVIIIGILAAIAIPVFLNQRERAWRSALASDLRNAAIEMETEYTDTGVYPNALPGAVQFSDGVALSQVVVPLDGQSYCLEFLHNNIVAPNTQAYDSNLGGLQDFPSTC